MNKHIAICVLSLALSVIMPAHALCELEFQEKPYIAFFEPYGYQSFNACRGYAIQHLGSEYIFPYTISEPSRIQWIERCSQLIDYFSEYGAEKSGYEIIVVKETYLPRVENKTLYIGYDTFDTIDIGIGMAKLCFGNHVNYGLLYGLASKAMNELYDVTEVNEPYYIDEILYSVDSSLLDMNYACFTQPYAQEDDIQLLKVIAHHMVGDIPDSNLRELLRAYSNTTFYSMLNSFLSKNGMPSKDFSFAESLTIYGGGHAIRLVIEDPYCIYYLQYDYSDYLAGAGLDADPLNESYEALVNILRAFRVQVEFVQKKFSAYLMPTKQCVRLLDTRTYFDSEGYFSQGVIYLGTIANMQHEYVHAVIALNGRTTKWMNETMACYYGELPWSLSNNSEDNLSFNFCASYMLHCFEFGYFADYIEQAVSQELIQRGGAMNPYDANSYITVSHRISCNNQRRVSDLQKTSGGLAAKYSFFAWLLENHTEDRVIKAIIYDQPDEQLGCDWDELVQLWENWLAIQDECNVGGKNEIH